MEKPLHEKICLSWFEADWLFYSQKQGWMHMLVFALLFEHHAIPCSPCFPCADPGFFVRGGGGSGSIWQKKQPDNGLFWFLSLFYWSQMINFEENYHFARFQRGSNIFQGGPTFSRGSNCLYPIETHITCDFPGGSGPPDRPLDPHLLSRPAGDIFFPFSRRWVVFFSFIQILIP